MKKKIILVAMLLLMAAGMASAQDEGTWSSHYNQGNLIGYAGANLTYGWYYSSIGVLGGAEMVVSQMKLFEVMPFDVTVGARAFANIYYYGGLGFGGYPYVGMHIGMKDLFQEEELSYLNNLDYYAGIGLGLEFAPWDNGNPLHIGFASHGGIAYFLSDNFAIFIEENYMYYYYATTLGISIKL